MQHSNLAILVQRSFTSPSTVWRLRFLLCATMLVAAPAVEINRAMGQAFQVFGPGMGIDEETIEEELVSSMKVEIDAIQRVTGIPDNVVKKLQVVSLLAVRSAIKDSPNQKVGAFPAFNQAAPKKVRDGALSDEEEEAKEEEAPPADVNFPVPIAGLGNMIDVRAVKNQEAWVREIGNALTPEQREKWSQFERDRTKIDRQSRVQAKVQELDQYLLLSPDQREKLLTLVDKNLGDDLMRMPVNGGMGGMGQVIIMMGPNGTKELSKDDLAPILSVAQLEQFERRKKIMAQGPLGLVNKAQGGFGKKNDNKGISSPLGFDFKEDTKGLRVTKVESDSRADRAGLRVDDIIDAVNDKPIDNSVQLRRALALLPSKSFNMTVKREGEVTTLTFEKKN